MIATLAGWNWFADWASFRFNIFRRFLAPPALVLVRRGQMIGRNLRRDCITVPELIASLGTQGVEKLAEVKTARLEPDGGISVIRWPDQDDANSNGAGQGNGGNKSMPGT